MNVSDFMILMVEDDPDQVLLTQRALARANLVNPLRIVANGEQAIAYLSGKEPYDNRKANPLPSLVLLDLKLPGIGGLEVLEWIRHQSPLKHLPVAVLTVSINPNDQKRATELGVSAYLCKPVDSEGLLAMMKSIGMYWMILSKSQESSARRDESLALPKGPHVLLVDPDRDLLSALAEGLRRRTPSVLSEIVTNPEDALRMISESDYDAVVLDRESFPPDDSEFLDRLKTASAGTELILLSERKDAKPGRIPRSGGLFQTIHKELPLSKMIDTLHHGLLELKPSSASLPDLERREDSALVPLASEAPAGRNPSRTDTEILGEQVRFQKTSWDLVRASGKSHKMNELIRIYWKPLYFFVRQKGFDNESAKDLVQEFLSDALERKTISKADPARGKFRTFLLAALSNFIKDRHKASSRLKRGGGCDTFSLDFDAGERHYALQVASGEAPDSMLDRAWAQCTLEACIADLAGNPAHVLAFRMLMEGSKYPQIAKETGLSEAAAKVAIYRIRQRLRDEVVRRISGSRASPEEAASDIAEFASLLY
jgi:RNA polymerase sigma factor (sigma-70 family)